MRRSQSKICILLFISPLWPRTLVRLPFSCKRFACSVLVGRMHGAFRPPRMRSPAPGAAMREASWARELAPRPGIESPTNICEAFRGFPLLSTTLSYAGCFSFPLALSFGVPKIGRATGPRRRAGHRTCHQPLALRNEHMAVPMVNVPARIVEQGVDCEGGVFTQPAVPFPPQESLCGYKGLEWRWWDTPGNLRAREEGNEGHHFSPVRAQADVACHQCPCH